MSQCDGYSRKFNSLWSLVSIGFKFSVACPDGEGIVRCEREGERKWRKRRLCLPHYRLMKGSVTMPPDDDVVGEVLGNGLGEPEDD